MSQNKSAAVKVAKEATLDATREVNLSTGVRAKLRPVATTLIDEVASRIKDPEVPMWHNPDKDRDEPNPNDPKYIAAKEEADRQRGIAVIDAVVMFGVELLDGVPDDGWLGKLQYLETAGPGVSL